MRIALRMRIYDLIIKYEEFMLKLCFHFVQNYLLTYSFCLLYFSSESVTRKYIGGKYRLRKEHSQIKS